jgi:hypothetical protein
MRGIGTPDMRVRDAGLLKIDQRCGSCADDPAAQLVGLDG